MPIPVSPVDLNMSCVGLWGHSAVADVATGRILVFGGLTQCGGQVMYSDQLWALYVGLSVGSSFSSTPISPYLSLSVDAHSLLSSDASTPGNASVRSWELLSHNISVAPGRAWHSAIRIESVLLHDDPLSRGADAVPPVITSLKYFRLCRCRASLMCCRRQMVVLGGTFADSLAENTTSAAVYDLGL